MPQAVAAVVAFAAKAWAAVTALYQSSLLFRAVVTIATMVGSQLLTKKPKQARDQGVELKTKFDPNMTRQIAVGRVATGGSMVAWWTHTDNKKLVRVIAISDWKIGALLKINANYDSVLTWDGNLLTGWRSCTNAFKSKSGVSKMRARLYDGTQTVADSYLISTSGGKWTSNHIGNNISYLAVEYEYDEEAFVKGEPSLVIEVAGAPAYDIRQDGSKIDGAGSERYEDPTTWEYRENVATIIGTFLRGYKVNGHLIVGCNADDDDLPLEMQVSASNVCEEEIDVNGDWTPNPTEARYTCGFMISANEEPQSVLTELAAAMDGAVYDRAGLISIIPGSTHTPVMDLTDEDIIWTEESSWQPDLSILEAYNYVSGEFIDPIKGYQVSPLPPLQNSTWEEEDGAGRLANKLSLNAVFSYGQAQRILKRTMESSRFQGTVGFVMAIWGIELQQGDWFTLTSSRWGFTSKTFELVDITLTKDLRLALIAREANPDSDVWDPAEDEKPYENPALGFVDAGLPVPSIGLTPTSVSSSDGLTITPAVSISITGQNSPYVAYVEIEQERIDGLYHTNLPPIAKDVTSYLAQGALTPGEQWRWRARTTDGNARFSDWTDWETATITADYAVPIARDSDQPLSGINRVRYAGMERDGYGWGMIYNPAGLSYLLSQPPIGGYELFKANFNPTGANQLFSIGTVLTEQPIPVTAGERLSIRQWVESQGPCADVKLKAWFYTNSSLTPISGADIQTKTGVLVLPTELAGFVDVPATARRMSLETYYKSNAAGAAALAVTETMVAQASAAQTKHPNYVPGQGSEPGAQVNPANLAELDPEAAEIVATMGISGVKGFNVIGSPVHIGGSSWQTLVSAELTGLTPGTINFAGTSAGPDEGTIGGMSGGSSMSVEWRWGHRPSGSSADPDILVTNTGRIDQIAGGSDPSEVIFDPLGATPINLIHEGNVEFLFQVRRSGGATGQDAIVGVFTGLFTPYVTP